MDFSEALIHLKEGKLVKRHDWGGYWFIPTTNPSAVVATKLSNITSIPQLVNLNNIILACLKDDGGYAPAQPYMADLFAEDWEDVEVPNE